MTARRAALLREVAQVRAQLKAQRVILDDREIRHRVGKVWDPWQEEVFDATHDQILLNCSRQSGKSTVAAYCGLREVVTRPGSKVLIVAPGERQSRLLYDAMLEMFRKLGGISPARAENALSLKLMNGSEVHALPANGATIRGYSAISLLIMDEASRIPDEVMATVRPMLAVSGGRLMALSTPWGKRGWWWDAWDSGGDDWVRWKVPATECPRIKPDHLERERRTIPPLFFDSEYMCQFVEPDDQLYGYDDIAAGGVEMAPFHLVGADR